MTETQEIAVHIDRNGRVRIEVSGVAGPKCEDLTRQLEQALGGVVVDRQYQDAYHQSVETTEDTARQDRDG